MSTRQDELADEQTAESERIYEEMRRGSTE